MEARVGTNGWWVDSQPVQVFFGVPTDMGNIMQPVRDKKNRREWRVLRYGVPTRLSAAEVAAATAFVLRFDRDVFRFSGLELGIETDRGCSCCGTTSVVLHYVYEIDLSWLDMTPEGYVRERVARGEKNPNRLEPWEQAYQDAKLIEAAEHAGYIEIGRNYGCDVTITDRGRALCSTPTSTEG